jgi:ribokinase
MVRDPKHLKRLGFRTGEAQCFALGAKIEVQKPILTVGGGAANAAVTFSRQGFKAASLFKVGRDDNGRAILAGLESERLIPLPLFDSQIGTAYSVILLMSSGERTILNYRGAADDIKQKELPFRKLMAKWAYISPGRIPLKIMTTILRQLKRNKTFIAMNPSKYYLRLGIRRLKPILDALQVIIVNREEASYLTGFGYEEEQKIFKKFDELVKGIAVLTDGPKGVLVSDGRKIYSAGVYKDKKIVDRTGAGDAFGSGFLAGLMRKISNFPACADLSAVPTAQAGASAGRQFPRLRRGLPDGQVGFGGQAISNFKEDDIKYAIRLGSANATSVVEQIGAQAGILRKPDFHSRRWEKLPIRIMSLR